MSETELHWRNDCRKVSVIQDISVGFCTCIASPLTCALPFLNSLSVSLCMFFELSHILHTLLFAPERSVSCILSSLLHELIATLHLHHLYLH